MNKKNIIKFLLMALPVLLLTSCLKDQEDIFPDSASARVSKYLANAKQVLTSAENGWVLDYFPDRNQSYGGYSYTLKFDDENVSVYCELADDEKEAITSTYTLKNEDGPVLMFDTYNEYMHFFATPTGSSGSGGYEAYDGDFIFIIMNISEDGNTIKLKGNRSGNILYMHKLSTTPAEYQTTLRTFVDNLVFDKAAGVINGANDTLYINANRRSIQIQTPDSLITAPFCFDADGFTLYEPIKIGDKEVKVFKYNESAGSFTAVENADVTFTGLLIPDIVINNVGDAITTGNDAAEFSYTFNLADQFDYSTDVDWITVSASGKNLTINVAENNTGNARSGHVIVEVGGEEAYITVSQMEVTDLVGTYIMTGIDSDDAPIQYATTVTKTDGADNEYALTFYYPNRNYPQTIIMTWNEDETRFELQSGQSLGRLGQYYSFLCFIDGGFSYWTSTSKSYTAYIIPSLNDEGKAVLYVGGNFGSNEVGGLCILVGTDPAIENQLGWYEAFMNLAFIKQ